MQRQYLRKAYHYVARKFKAFSGDCEIIVWTTEINVWQTEIICWG
jgi:hypothetical protein